MDISAPAVIDPENCASPFVSTAQDAAATAFDIEYRFYANNLRSHQRLYATKMSYRKLALS
jgi:TPP-dependent trihydroxycyclohexane-1,2-dione (THcHDO) dehydratase